MFILALMIIVLIILAIIFNNPTTIEIKNTNSNNLQKYISKKYIMTQTELQFFRELKKITDELDLLIFPQVNLERIIQVKDNNTSDRNRIKSRSIDYTIVNNRNCKIIACIELDDYTHYRKKSMTTDEFKNSIFNQTGIPLIRIKVNNNYKFEELKEKLDNYSKQASIA